MAFTFTIPFDDIARFRLALNDLDPNTGAHRFEDELIQALIDEKDGEWQKAVIVGLDLILMDLATPDFTADWLKIDSKSALAFYTQKKADLLTEYELAGGVVWSSDPVFPTLYGTRSYGYGLGEPAWESSEDDL
jgi:hypothetical protein